jgi:hypothetical protein
LKDTAAGLYSWDIWTLLTWQGPSKSSNESLLEKGFGENRADITFG